VNVSLTLSHSGSRRRTSHHASSSVSHRTCGDGCRRVWSAGCGAWGRSGVLRIACVGGLLLNDERRALNQYVIHLSSRGSSLSTSGSIHPPAAHDPLPYTQIHTRGHSTFFNFPAGGNLAATDGVCSSRSSPSCEQVSGRTQFLPRLSRDSHCSLVVCGIDSRGLTRGGRTGRWW